ncbi:hypothetical protein AAFP35_07740 [Gordonia sp. CPCC 206044]|uniref:hypothetical protein n=1 Tax=Gordonia sp. CPCC 206044 TaxID=3140793 RepID=UPI003AF40422
MSRVSNSLAALREHAADGIDDLIDVLALGATLGVPGATPDEVRRPFRVISGLDVSGITADGHRLSTAHRAVAEQLHQLPEQQVRLGWGWASESGERALAAVVDHQRRAEADLHVLRTLSDATNAASSGIDQLLRTWFVTVARLSAPLVAGVPIAEVPGAIVVGELPPSVVVADIASRADLYFSSAEATVDGVDEILGQLNRATEGMDIEPYPGVVGPVPPSADRSSVPGASTAPSGAMEPSSPSVPAVPPAGSSITDDGSAGHATAPETTEGPQGDNDEVDVPFQLTSPQSDPNPHAGDAPITEPSGSGPAEHAGVTAPAAPSGPAEPTAPAEPAEPPQPVEPGRPAEPAAPPESAEPAASSDDTSGTHAPESSAPQSGTPGSGSQGSGDLALAGDE